MHAETRDEWDSDPLDDDDPSGFYEVAALLQPDSYFADGSRVRQFEPMTPEREEKLEAEAEARREQFLAGLQSGDGKVRYAGGDDAAVDARRAPPSAARTRKAKSEL